MAHTAVAATIYPLLVAIYALYGEGDKQTKFGKGLFIGMAYVAGAGSIVTLLGAARGAVALGFFKDVAGKGHGLLRIDLLYVSHRLADDLSAVGLFHGGHEAGKGHHPRSAGKGQATEQGDGRHHQKRNPRFASIVIGAILVLGVRPS
jgi:hypothetical protein